MDARLATADTELLGDPTCRRFLMCVWAQAGSRLTVTPTVADELVGNVRQSERRHWEHVLEFDEANSNWRYEDETYSGIIEAAIQAAGEWIVEEPRREPPGGLSLTFATKDEQRKARMLAARIPRECFRRPDRRNQAADRRIVAEATVLGYTLLASENLSTLKEKRINAWLREEGYVDEPLVMPIDDALERLSRQRSREETALDAVLAAALPDQDRGIERDLRTIGDFLERLKRGHARPCAIWAEDAWNEERTPHERIGAARMNLPEAARETEMRRVRKVRSAARSAGYVER